MSRAAEHVVQVAADAASASAAKATYFGGALSAVGGMALSSEFMALAGLLLALLGWLTQVYFSARRDHRDAEEHVLRMQQLRAQQQQVR